MQDSNPPPTDERQDGGRSRLTRGMNTLLRAASTRGEAADSPLHSAITFFSQVCEDVTTTPHHPLGLFVTAAPPQQNGIPSSLSLGPAAGHGHAAAWTKLTDDQPTRTPERPDNLLGTEMPPTSPVSPPVAAKFPLLPAPIGPQLGVAPLPSPEPAAALQDAATSPPTPPRRRPRRPAGGVTKARKPRSTIKPSPGSSTLGAEQPSALTPAATASAARRKRSAGSGATTHMCQVPKCNRSFARTYNLHTHMRTHTGDCPYACQYDSCTKRFKWKSSLTSHRKYHEKRDAEKQAATAAAAAAAAAVKSKLSVTGSTEATPTAPDAGKPEDSLMAVASLASLRAMPV
ncbi:hypothetical protein BU14_0070s0076 [Porphyra umbilicalis]|uniref:C2H2-type domain-containing protein n=1 Tax=Porphyra umbilicalis TaxID=2786 RepID=A0A1X6PGB9_PORUM|nr:hypothetical protein BU14_0070s0076 [Porphyra umbilicalis]|eukprot:OSX79901.1 hypothetical protein BU14_0070s0076 [Porphyra umbilicalis]